MSFFGSRTYHIGVVAVALAGFEIRDEIMWIHSQGFPHGQNVAKAIDLAGGESPADLGDLLKAKREALGLTRMQVAEFVGCTEASVRDWEEGRARAEGKAPERVILSKRYRAKLDALFGYPSDQRQMEGFLAVRTGDGTILGLGHKGILWSGGHTDQSKNWEGVIHFTQACSRAHRRGEKTLGGDRRRECTQVWDRGNKHRGLSRGICGHWHEELEEETPKPDDSTEGILGW